MEVLGLAASTYGLEIEVRGIKSAKQELAESMSMKMIKDEVQQADRHTLGNPP